MQCDTARRHIDRGERASDLAAHLERCPACRAAAALVDQIGAAVAAWPPVAAPAALTDAVMAVLRNSTPARAARRVSPIRLRPAEMVWLAAAFLLMLALIPRLLAPWLPAGLEAPALSLAAGSVWLQGLRDVATIYFARLGSDLGVLINAVTPAAGMGRGLDRLVWMTGIAAFSILFCLLLSWRLNTASVPASEDVHA